MGDISAYRFAAIKEYVFVTTNNGVRSWLQEDGNFTNSAKRHKTSKALTALFNFKKQHGNQWVFHYNNSECYIDSFELDVDGIICLISNYITEENNRHSEEDHLFYLINFEDDVGAQLVWVSLSANTSYVFAGEWKKLCDAFLDDNNNLNIKKLANCTWRLFSDYMKPTKIIEAIKNYEIYELYIHGYYTKKTTKMLAADYIRHTHNKKMFHNCMSVSDFILARKDTGIG